MILPERIELIIFDMDGLMFDTETISFESWVKAAEDYGYIIEEELFHKTIGTNMKKTRTIYENHFGPEFPMDIIIEKRTELSEEIVKSKGIPVKKGLYELLEYLKESDVKLAVATSASRKRAVKFLTISDVIGYFDCIICGDEVRESKPHPEIFLKACEFMGVKEEHTLVLEDSEAGIVAATKAHMISIMIPDVLQPSDDIRTKAYAVLKNLNDVKDIINEALN